MRTCPNCKNDMTVRNAKEYVPDHCSYGCDTKSVVVGRWHTCDACGMVEYEKVR